MSVGNLINKSFLGKFFQYPIVPFPLAKKLLGVKPPRELGHLPKGIEYQVYTLGEGTQGICVNPGTNVRGKATWTFVTIVGDHLLYDALKIVTACEVTPVRNRFVRLE